VCEHGREGETAQGGERPEGDDEVVLAIGLALLFVEDGRCLLDSVVRVERVLCFEIGIGCGESSEREGQREEDGKEDAEVDTEDAEFADAFSIACGGGPHDGEDGAGDHQCGGDAGDDEGGGGAGSSWGGEVGDDADDEQGGGVDEHVYGGFEHGGLLEGRGFRARLRGEKVMGYGMVWGGKTPSDLEDSATSPIGKWGRGSR
jgi:hypothetical protein